MTITLALAFGGIVAAVAAILAGIYRMVAGGEADDDRRM